jgi:putative ABC transport system permease protein
MKTLITLAWRNLWRNTRRTWITVFSVVFAIVLAVFLESMDRGSQESMVGNVVRFSTGFIQIQDSLYKEEPFMDNSMYYDAQLEEYLLQEFSDVAYTIPRIESFALAAGELKSRVAMISGIDPEMEHRFNSIQNRLTQGVFFTDDEMEVVIGEGLAKNLDLKVGDTLVLLGQGFQGMTAAGKFFIAGTIKHPVPEMNEMMVFMKIEDAQWFFSAYDRLTSLIIAPVNPNRHIRLANELKKSDELSDYTIYTWEELQPELVRTVEFDQAGTFIFLLILYVVIAFGIFGTILTMTLEREREFGVLISVGMHRWKLSLVVFIETLIINFMGVLIGLVLSLPVVIYFYLNPIPLGEEMGNLMAEYGMEAVLAFSLDPQIFYQQGIMIFFISMLIVLYPMSRIISLDVLSAARK